MSRKVDAHHLIYFFLYGLLALALILLGLSFFNKSILHFYHNVYFVVLLSYTWYITMLLFLSDFRDEKFKRYKNETIAVLIPLFNEEGHLFKAALKSVLKAKGNKEVFVIDDGSNRGIDRRQLRLLCAKYGVNLHVFRNNRGKRHALYHGVKKMIKDHQFIVTIDSDTIVDEDALIRVVEPLKYDNVAASTGDIRLLNEKQNLLTRMIGSYYWIGLHIYKRAQSTIGSVVCCSGALAAYKTEVLKDVIDDFIKQEFLGEKCTHSEDRHLTNLVLKKGYSVKFTDKAISYTNTPHTISGFLKQQQRWKRGFIRESTFTLSYAWKSRPLLFLQIALCELTLPFFAFGLMIALVVTVLTNPHLFLSQILPAWIAFMFVRYIYILFHGRQKIPGLFIYMFFYEIFLYWQFIYALFTVRNHKWLTR